MTAEPSAAARRKPKTLNVHGRSALSTDPPIFPPTRRHPGPPPAPADNLRTPAPLATTAGRSKHDEEDHHTDHHQKQITTTQQQLPKPPRSAGEETQEEEIRRTTFTTSPATPPERGKEGKDIAQPDDASATVFGAAT